MHVSNLEDRPSPVIVSDGPVLPKWRALSQLMSHFVQQLLPPNHLIPFIELHAGAASTGELWKINGLQISGRMNNKGRVYYVHIYVYKLCMISG